MSGRRPALALAAALLGAACAGRAPVRLEVPTAALALPAGGRAPFAVVLVNPGRRPVTLADVGGLGWTLACHTADQPPGADWGIGFGGPVTGVVFGGVADATPTPDDPKFCRLAPPETLTLAAGERRTLATEVEAPAECLPGAGELEISFAAHDDGRRCPGIWHGTTKTVKRPVTIVAPR